MSADLEKVHIEATRTDIVVSSMSEFLGDIKLDLSNEPEKVIYSKAMKVKQTEVDEAGRLQITGTFGTSGKAQITIKATQAFVQMID